MAEFFNKMAHNPSFRRFRQVATGMCGENELSVRAFLKVSRRCVVDIFSCPHVSMSEIYCDSVAWYMGSKMEVRREF